MGGTRIAALARKRHKTDRSVWKVDAHSGRKAADCAREAALTGAGGPVVLEGLPQGRGWRWSQGGAFLGNASWFGKGWAKGKSP